MGSFEHPSTRKTSVNWNEFSVLNLNCYKSKSWDGQKWWAQLLPVRLQWLSLFQYYTSHPTVSHTNFESCFPHPKQSGISRGMFSTRQDFKGNAAVSQFVYICQFDCGCNLEADMKGWTWKNILKLSTAMPCGDWNSQTASSGPKSCESELRNHDMGLVTGVTCVDTFGFVTTHSGTCLLTVPFWPFWLCGPFSSFPL